MGEYFYTYGPVWAAATIACVFWTAVLIGCTRLILPERASRLVVRLIIGGLAALALLGALAMMYDALT
jgi:hypothetical protein